MLELLLILASKMSEDAMVQGDVSSAMTIKEIDNEIDTLTQPGSAYWDKNSHQP